MQVGYLGLNSVFGRISSSLLKESPFIEKLTLYDDSESSEEIKDKDLYFGTGRLKDAVKDVNIVVIGDETCADGSENNHLEKNGRKVIRYTEAVLEASPSAIVIVASSPINVMVPLAGHILGPDRHSRLLGVTSIDTLRASKILAGLLNPERRPPHVLPVIGGSSLATRVPLFSQIHPKLELDNDLREKLIKKFKYNDREDFQEVDAVERAFTTVRFIHSVIQALRNDSPVPDIAMAKTSVISGVNYFSLPMLIGEKGVEKQFLLPCVNSEENEMFNTAIENLNKDAKSALALFRKIKSDTQVIPPSDFPPIRADKKQMIVNLHKENKSKGESVPHGEVNSHRIDNHCGEGNIFATKKIVPLRPFCISDSNKIENAQPCKFENQIERQASSAGSGNHDRNTRVDNSDDESVTTDAECFQNNSKKTIGLAAKSLNAEECEDVENDFSGYLEREVTSHLNTLKIKPMNLGLPGSPTRVVEDQASTNTPKDQVTPNAKGGMEEVDPNVSSFDGSQTPNSGGHSVNTSPNEEINTLPKKSSEKQNPRRIVVPEVSNTTCSLRSKQKFNKQRNRICKRKISKSSGSTFRKAAGVVNRGAHKESVVPVSKPANSVFTSLNPHQKSCEINSKGEENADLVTDGTKGRKSVISSSNSVQVVARDLKKRSLRKKTLSKVGVKSPSNIPTSSCNIKSESELSQTTKLVVDNPSACAKPAKNITSANSDSSGNVLCTPDSGQTCLSNRTNDVFVPSKNECSQNSTRQYFICQRESSRQIRNGLRRGGRSSDTPDPLQSGKLNLHKDESENMADGTRNRVRTEHVTKELKNSSQSKSCDREAQKRVSHFQPSKKKEIRMDENSSQISDVTKIKDDSTPKNNHVWESKYFTKASETFFKMFRDTVTDTSGSFQSKETVSHKERTKIKDNSPIPTMKDISTGKIKDSEQEIVKEEHLNKSVDPKMISKNVDTQCFRVVDNNTNKMMALTNNARSSSLLSCKTDTSATPNKTNFLVLHTNKCLANQDVVSSGNSSSLKHENKTCNNTHTAVAGAENVSSKKDSEKSRCDATKENLDCKDIANESEYAKKRMSFEVLFDESCTIPLMKTKGNSSSLITKHPSSPRSLSDSLIATSEKRRGDPSNVIDYSISRNPKRFETVSEKTVNPVGRTVGKTRSMKNFSAQFKPKISLMPPKCIKSLKQVNDTSKPTSLETKKQEPDISAKANKWERIVTIFRNIIMNDIEGDDFKPKFESPRQPHKKLESKTPNPKNTQIPHGISHSSGRHPTVVKVAKPCNPPRKKRVTHKKNSAKTIIGNRTVKNSPKKIVNYFYKRGHVSTYDKPNLNDGHPQGRVSSSDKAASKIPQPSNSPSELK